MTRILILVSAVLVLSAPDARAERASVATAKAVVAASKVVVRATKPVPTLTWRGLKWVAAHI